MISFPGRRDARWDDPVWRTQTLRQLVATNTVTIPEVADLLNRDVGVVYHWHSDSQKVISRKTLRLLVLEIQERDRRGA